ncbi:MAG TPA: carbamoyltransferase HypF [bacterium]|nr:carbamoyltransferase HypF [bacterium]
MPETLKTTGKSIPLVTSRLRLSLRGAVQGVGFRPFIYRLATDLGLKGWVVNSPQGVVVEAEGPFERLESFLLKIEREKPPRSFIQGMEPIFLDAKGYEIFEIKESDGSGDRTTFIMPDIATCPDCLAEIGDPANRRYRYPFTNCTNCGPRFSIVESLHYDRANTSMKKFRMCQDCRREYGNPEDRRFHAEPNACAACGPQLELWDHRGKILEKKDNALLSAAKAITQGAIVAVKGIGGYHLILDARMDEAVVRIRERKRHNEKPFALMFPSLGMIKVFCEVSEFEERVLTSSEAPITLLNRKPRTALPFQLASAIAPDNPGLGVMLPYSPLHHLLMRELGFPVVATSGNLFEETIVTSEKEALTRLGGVADLFLVHNRPIIRFLDDSIVRIMSGREMVLRRARGFVPLPVTFSEALPSILACGAHLKNTVAISKGREIFLSQHVGDLEAFESWEAFKKITGDLTKLYGFHPEIIVCDLHPGYRSTQWARGQNQMVIPVQHHLAHLFACMAENEIEPPFTGVSWDGTGLGLDGTIWGGELFTVSNDGFERVASLRNFRLPGGEQAVREPRRSAMGLLYEMFGDEAFEMDSLAPFRAFLNHERKVLKEMLSKPVHSPVTSSAGRLFDAVSSLLGLCQVAGFEGQAAMALEFACHGSEIKESYPFRLSCSTGLKRKFPSGNQRNYPKFVIDWGPMLHEILKDLQANRHSGEIAAKFHNTLAEMIVNLARKTGHPKVVLSGGCFQNKYLTEETLRRLKREGVIPYWHQRIPPNDGGIALGQIVAASRMIGKEI